MKQIAFILILVLTLGLLSAQSLTTWQNVRHSAIDANGDIHVRFNGVPDVTGNYEMYSYQSNAWSQVTLESPDVLLYEGLIPAQVGQAVSYRLKTSLDMAGQSIVALNPAYYTADAFPPTLASMAFVAEDPVGDSVMVYYPNLDITGTWCGYSQNKIYAAVSNQTNSFTTMNSLTSYNMYFAGLVNAVTALTDSTIYAMVYTFNLPGVISPGLYKLGMNLADTTVVYQRLGNISSQVVGGKLFLACNIADLTADPGFGAWPPEGNAFGYIAGTLRLDVDLGSLTPAFGFGDYSALGQMVFEHYNYTVGANAQPVISDVSLTGNAATRTLTMTYNDANGDFPLTARFVQDTGNEIDLVPDSYDFSQPVTLSAAFATPGWSSGTIRISDNNIGFVTYEVANVAVDDEVAPANFSLNIGPNPFRLSAGELNIKLNSTVNTPVTGGIYNLKGQCVRHLNLLPASAGNTLTWDGVDAAGQKVADGIYFVKLTQGANSLSQKVIVLK